MEAMMQESVPTGGETQTRLFNPILDLAIAVSEAQLKAWQAYQVEGTRFVAKRLRANLELLRALGHCTDIPAIGECQRCWLSDLRQDYGEEWGRLVGTTCALGFADLAPMGWPFGRPAARTSSESPSRSKPGPQSQRQAA
jgi:hypothetical protein